jgi:hypothetical protein
MPSANIFTAQSDEYRDKPLTPGLPLVLMEHYGFTVDTICGRTRHLQRETRRTS